MTVASDSGLKVPVIIITKILNVSYPIAAQVRIENICDGVQKARESRRVLLLELTSYATLEVAEIGDKSLHFYDRSISLANFLEDTALDADERMSPIE